jgi:hypothetical protein
METRSFVSQRKKLRQQQRPMVEVLVSMTPPAF